MSSMLFQNHDTRNCSPGFETEPTSYFACNAYTYERTKLEVVKNVKNFLKKDINIDVHGNDYNTPSNHFGGLNCRPRAEVVRLTLIYLDRVQQNTVPAFIFIDVEQEEAYGCWQPP